MSNTSARPKVQYRKTYRFLIAFLVTLALAIVVDLVPFELETGDAKLTDFRESFIEKERNLDKVMNEVSSGIAELGLVDWMLNEAPTVEERMDGYDFHLVVFEKDRMVYWSDNNIQMAELLNVPDFDKELFYLGNSWCYAIKRMQGPFEIFGLIQIKTQYPYENQLLHSSFSMGFDLPSHVQIIADPELASYSVTLQDGTPAFGLANYDSIIKKPMQPLLAAILYALAILLLLLLLINLFANLFSRYQHPLLFFAFLVSIVVLRMLLLEYKIPGVFYDFEIFGPSFFGKSGLFASLGDFLLNAIFILAISYFVTLHNYVSPMFRKRGKRARRTLVATLLIVCLVFFLVVDNLLGSLILHSTINFDLDRIFSVDAYSVVGYVIVSLLLFGFVLVLDKYLRKSVDLVPFGDFIIISLSSVSLVSILAYLLVPNINLYSIGFYVLFVLPAAVVRYNKWRLVYSTLIFFLFVASFYTSTRVSQSLSEKDVEVKKVMAVNLATERDLLAESFVESFNDQLMADTTIPSILFEQSDVDLLYDFVKKNYFSGYWDKYELQLFVCGAEDSILIETESRAIACREFFDGMIDESGVSIPNSNFFFIDNFNGRISYLGEYDFIDPTDSVRLSVFVDLNSKLQNLQLGYPELLIEGNLNGQSLINDYSYAKYKDGVLVTQAGEFTYSLSDAVYRSSDQEFSILDADGWGHLIYRIDNHSLIVVSSPSRQLLDSLVMLSYIFVLFHIIFTLVLFFYRFPNQFLGFNFGFKNKIQVSMISVLLLSLVLIGTGTIYFNIKQYNAKHNEIISEKIQSVLVELEHKIGGEESLGYDMQDYLTYYLVKFSNVFYTDINMYNLDGDLLASSRPEIYESNLVGTKINTQAYRQMHLMQKANFVHQEEIGDLKYLSAYVPFSNNNNKVLAYLNLPYFAKEKLMKKEISGLITAVVNIYVLLIILTILLTVLISNQITRPLQLIQDKMNEVRLGKPNEKIVYQSKDEIGSLIEDYNRMMDELQRSAEKLARSERESAWREMARQIAHEIKNPLTPMRLHLQHLQKTVKEKQDGLPERIDKVSNILIGQIDALSAIATEFSNFANMPRAKNTEFDLCLVLDEILSLFNKEEVKLSIHHKEGLEAAMIYADREQIQRVFINLVKNGIQAVPEGKEAMVQINLKQVESDFQVEVKDNGSGISEEVQEKLFRPNFTTKTSGMGLGLSIVKGSVESAGGRIWFETVKDNGTSFYVCLPKLQLG